MSHHEHAEHGQQEHASLKTYFIVLIVLAVLTAIEVAIPYAVEPLKESMAESYPRALFVTLMLALALAKFFIVVAFFMHLKYDHRFYSESFGFAMVIAIITFIVLAYYLSPDEPPNQRMVRLKKEGKLPVAAAPVQEEIGPADPEAGKAVFSANGCMACHVISSLPGAVGTTGPKLDGLGKIAASRVAGMDAEAYIKQSIEDPYAYVVDGYMKVMPNMRANMSGQDFVNLVAYLKSL